MRSGEGSKSLPPSLCEGCYYIVNEFTSRMESPPSHVPPLNAATLVEALHGALQPEQANRRAYEEALGQWEGCTGFSSALLQLYASPPPGLGQPERLLAVLCLKNTVTRRWHQRRQDEPTISDAEKASLREGLLCCLDEADGQIWVQLELLMAVIARLDGLGAWPQLMPTLLEAASRSSPRAASRGLCALHRVVKQQASRRLLPHRKQFFALAEELLPRLQPLRTHASALVAALAQRSPEEAVAWLTAPLSPAAADGGGGAALVQVATALCKLERQLLLHGWPHLHQSPEPCAVLAHYFDVLVAAEAQQRRLLPPASSGTGYGLPPAAAPVGGSAAATAAAESLMPLLLIPAKLLMELQDLQPLATHAVLPNAIAFFLQQMASRPFEPSPESADEKFLVRGLMFLRNALSTSAYLPTRQAPPQAHACRQVLQAFFASPSLPQLITALLTRALPLSEAEHQEYVEDPEAFVYEEHLARESNSLRKCAERCLLTLADTHECRLPVQQSVLALSNEAAASGLDSLGSILTLDACYFGLGLVLPSGPDASQLSSVLETLRHHCAIANVDHAHLLRRRAAWLVGWILKTPLCNRLRTDDLCGGGPAAGGNEAAQPSASAIMYAMLTELLADSHPGVRLAAALAVQGLFDTTDTSPRADTFSAASSAAGTDPLAKLAASALLPVLHLSLHVAEMDSRWRMTQLLCRLLGRLASTPSLLEPQLAALAEWMPTAWAACQGEQLLLEATLDAASTMLTSCHSPPPFLLVAALRLVDQATSSSASSAAGSAAGSPPTSPSPTAGAAAPPPVGLVEMALRLWRACLSTMSPPAGAGLSPQLLGLAGRLPALVVLGDELIRPIMLLLDWCALSK